MTNLFRWPWTRHLPEPAPTEILEDLDTRMIDAEAVLAEVEVQQEEAVRQATSASRFVHRLGGIMAENHIGPAIEQTIRRKHDR